MGVGLGGGHFATDRPQKGGHLACDGRHHDWQLLAGIAQPAIAGAEPDLRFPGNIAHGFGQSVEPAPQGFADPSGHHEPGAAQERHLREELVKILLGKHQLDTALVNVTVSDGNVRLWGVVENADEAAAAQSAAKTLPGVKSVENNLGPGPMSGVPA